MNNTKRSLVIASSNPGKLREIQDILGAVPFSLLLPAQAGVELDVEETGDTYAENAALKAQAYADATGLMCLADDSGLEVDALGGKPGLHSARYAPWPNANDADRRQVLLQNLQGCAQPWNAAFRCVVAVAVPGQPMRLFEGHVDGVVIPEERGSGGFGYDPIFFMPALGLTMAELPEAEKNRISHRARALQAALPYLLEHS